MWFENLLKGLCFTDSFFPSGAYAHSSGLEAAVQQGDLKGVEDLEAYLADMLTWGVARSDALVLSVVHRAFSCGDFDTVVHADRQLEAIKTVQIMREASRLMGRQVLKIGSERISHEMVKRLYGLVELGETPGHHAASLGLVLGACQWSRPTAVSVYLFQTVTGWVSAALRLLPIGQSDGQRILHALIPLVAQITEEVEGLQLANLAHWMPLHEIRAMNHLGQNVRLFRS